MTKWEYETLSFSSEAGWQTEVSGRIFMLPLIEVMNVLGGEGWQLVTTVTDSYYFMRPKFGHLEGYRP